MRCQTRSLRLKTCIHKKLLHQSYIEYIHFNFFGYSSLRFSSTATQHTFNEPLKSHVTQASNASNQNHRYPFSYEIRLGPIASNIPTKALQTLAQHCSDECRITKTRNSKALYIQSENDSDINTFQSLVHEQFLQHRTSIDAGDKTRFVAGPKSVNLHALQRKSQAFIYLNFNSGQISIYGTKSAVQKAKQLLTEYLNKIIFVELDNKISWICARNHSWISRMKQYYECEIYSEPTGRLVIIAESHITKQILHSVNNGLSKAPPDSEIRNKKVDQHKLKQKVQSQTNIADVIRIARNNHHFVNINNIHSIFNKLRALRQTELEQERLMLNINEFDKYRNTQGQQRLDDALLMRRKKNNDYMYFMSKYARQMLGDITSIVTVAEFMWCFALFGMKRFGHNMHGAKETMWPFMVERVLELYRYDDPRAHNQSGKDLNTLNKKLYALTKCFGAFSLLHPLEYKEYNEHLAFILKELHQNIAHLGGGMISYVLDSITKKEDFLQLCRNCSFLCDKEENVWRYLSNEENYRNIDNLGHVNVHFIFKSLCVLYPNFHANYSSIDGSQDIIESILNLCNELFFYHESLEIHHSIEMLADLTCLGFYESTLFDFLLPMEKLSKIDIHDAKIYNKASIHRLLYSFGKSLHRSHPEILTKMSKQLVEYRSTFNFSQYIECVWSVLCIHFLSASQHKTHRDVFDEAEAFLLSKKMIDQLLKTMAGTLSDCDISMMSNDIVIKLLQMNVISKILKVSLASIWMEARFESMLKDGLQSELLMAYKYSEDDWDRNEYNTMVLKCINRIWYGHEIESESFLMKNKYELVDGNTSVRSKKMQFDHVLINGLTVNLCVDDRQKRGIMIYGPNDVFIDNEEKLCGENYINYHLLTTYFDWDLLCLNSKTHSTEHSITEALNQWFDKQQKKHIPRHTVPKLSY